jgi:hypothetical protein
MTLNIDHNATKFKHSDARVVPWNKIQEQRIYPLSQDTGSELCDRNEYLYLVCVEMKFGFQKQQKKRKSFLQETANRR